MKKNLLFITDKLSKTLFLFSVILFISFGVKAGKLRVVAAITYSTEAVAASNVLQGSQQVLLYTLKVTATSDPVSVNAITYTILGNYTSADLQYLGVYTNTTNSLTGATNTANNASTSTGSGETKSQAATVSIPAGESRYIFITATIKSDAVDGRTLKINGLTSNISLTFYSALPTVTNNQTDVAGVQTITAPKITLITESVTPANINQGSYKTLLYVFKAVITDSPVDISTFKVKTEGTYTAADFQNFEIFSASTNDFTVAKANGSAGYGNTAIGTIIINGNEQIPLNTTRYFFVTGNVSSNAVDGRTLKVNGGNNPISFVSSSYNPTVINNQTDIVGVQTIIAPKITLTTESVVAANINQGSYKALLYVFKAVITDSPVDISTFKVKTEGSYTAADFQNFEIFSASTNDFTVAKANGSAGYGSSAIGTININGYNQISINTTRYFFVTGNASINAVDGRTIKVNGGNNPISFVSSLYNPTDINNQTDIAGIQTIKAPKITIITQTLAPSNVAPETEKLIHIYKLNVTEGPVDINTFVLASEGIYTNSDMATFNIYSNTTNNFNTATYLGNRFAPPINDIRINLNSENLITGQEKYYFITSSIGTGAVSNNSIKINSVGVLSNTSTLVVTKILTDISGKQTIGTPLFTYTTESSTAKIIAKGTINHPFYTLKMVGGSVGGTITNLAIQTAGTYNSTDIGSFTLYKNSIPSITGATLVATDNTLTGTGETLTFPTGYVEIDAGTTTYFIVRANINTGATSGNTFFINGGTNPITTTNSGLVATITNSQTNVAGIQTIGVPPTFTSVISNIAANTMVNLCTAVVNYTPTTAGSPTPTLSYIFTGATTGSGSGSGSSAVFNKGVTNVVITATNACLPNATQSFTVTISDVQLPTITAPANVTANTNTACTATGVVLGTPTTSDNCSVASTTNNAPTAFPLGVTTVVWTVTDGSGNVKTANQTVTVTDNVLPTITAPANVTANTNTACTATGVALGTPTTADNCSVASVTNNAPTTYNLGANTVTWTVTDGAINSKTATQTVTVVDNVLPTITAPANVTAIINTACTATGVVLGTPTTADNCSVASTTNNAPTAFPIGVTTVIWTVTDGAGNSKTANQTVTVTDNVLPTITAPANVNATTNTACTATGIVLGTPTTSDNCSVASTTNNAPTAFPLGVTTVIWTVTDGSGNVKTANQTVTVTDNVLPTITAPANITATGCTSATGVVLGTPTTTDNCSVASTTNNAPTTFPAGITTVIWTVTDGAGNSKTATQTVTVVDNVLPTITAPANVTAIINTACTATGVVLGTPTTADNCYVASTTNNAPTVFPIGVTTVIWTVTDGAGNSKTANQTVTVTDNVLPAITAPANVNATTNTACTATGVVLGTPTTSDNCSVASTTNNAPTAFPLGTTTVIWTVTDGSGNIKTATQTVTITDNVLPTITAPANVNATTNTTCTATGVVLGTPTTADNCSVALITNNAPTTFPIGSTTVIWTVTDGAGNIQTANQTVTVTSSGGIGSIAISTQSGDWNTSSTWQCGDIPTLTKQVEIQSGHLVNISGNVHAKSIKLLGTGKLNYTGTTGKLFLNQ